MKELVNGNAKKERSKLLLLFRLVSFWLLIYYHANAIWFSKASILKFLTSLKCTSCTFIQFEKASEIQQIDIGNEGSAFVEVLVARGNDDFQVLVKSMNTFLSKYI